MASSNKQRSSTAKSASAKPAKAKKVVDDDDNAGGEPREKKKFYPPFEIEEPDFVQKYDNGELRLAVEWNQLREFKGEQGAVHYGDVRVCVGDGPLHQLRIRTAMVHALTMSPPGTGYQKRNAPQFVVLEGRGRALQPEGADTTVYETAVRERIRQFLEAEVAAGKLPVQRGRKVIDTWVRRMRIVKDAKGNETEEEYADGPYVINTLKPFTEFFDALEVFSDEQSGTEELAPLKYRGKPVTHANVHETLKDFATVVTYTWTPEFNISKAGVSPHAQVISLAVFPGTGEKREAPSAGKILGNRYKPDTKLLEKLRAAAAQAKSSKNEAAFDSGDEDAGDAGAAEEAGDDEENDAEDAEEDEEAEDNEDNEEADDDEDEDDKESAKTKAKVTVRDLLPSKKAAAAPPAKQAAVKGKARKPRAETQE